MSLTDRNEMRKQMFAELPNILMSSTFRNDKDARRLSAIAVVACGYGGDMPESLCNELLDDMDFYYNKVKCRKIERMLPALSKIVVKSKTILQNNIQAYCKNTQQV